MGSDPREFPVLPEPPSLTSEDEGRLSVLAARAVADACLGRPSPSRRASDEDRSAGLRLRCGVFVTIFEGEELRGCLGVAEGTETLLESVPRLAYAAATRDPRFDPVQRSELDRLRVEMTLLGALTRLPSNIASLLKGLDPRECGVYLRARGRTGLLLPQVARRLGWGAEELLEQVSWKAGLEGDVWKDPGTEIFGFRARTLPEARPSAYAEPPS